MHSPIRWIISFTVALGALFAVAAWIAFRLPSFRDPPLDFYAMHYGEYFVDYGLTRRQDGALKIGFAESHAAPPIGAFGNHIIAFFGADAFGAPERGEFFFNYYYANLSLPEVLEMMTHIEAHGDLPSKLMIVQITPPNADNGNFIINHGNELPPDVVLHTQPGASLMSRTTGIADTAWRTIETNLHEVLNYNTLILGALQNEHTVRATGPYVCRTRTARPAAPAWFAKLPWTVRKLLMGFLVTDRCENQAWDWTLRRDGSAYPPPRRTAPLRLNEDALAPADRGLKAGDEREIAKYLRAIDAIGQRHGAKVVFIVTPVYETDRHDSVVNQILNRSFALAPELTLIDDREMHPDPSMFINSLHVGPDYYRILVEKLRARGLLDGIGDPSPSPPPVAP